MGTKVIYEDVSPLAKIDNGEYTSEDKKDFVNMHDLKENASFPNYALCLPKYSLIGEYINSPELNTSSKVGYVSNSISNELGLFNNNPIIERVFEAKHSSVGLTLVFNEYSGDYASLINIKWYEDDALLADEDFNIDNTTYFCNKNVSNFNKIIIEFKATNKSYRYIFISQIEYGVIRTFLPNEIKGITTLIDLSPISDIVPINTMNFNLYSDSNVDYLFQKTQKMKLLFNENLIGNFYINTSTRLNKNEYTIQLEDAIGILNKKMFVGGIYNNKPFVELINEIMTLCKVQYEIVGDFSSEIITGHMPKMTCRDALAWILFVVGANVITYNNEILKIQRLDNEVKRQITEDNQYSGRSIQKLEKVTGINVVAYTYELNSESELLYEGEINGETMIDLPTPATNLTINNGTIVESGNNYVIVTGTGTVQVSGQVYNQNITSKTRTNESIGSLDLENIYEVSGITIINPQNIDNVLNRVYDYYLKEEQINVKIILGENKIGDLVEVDCDYEGIKTARIEQMNMNITNNSISAQAVMK